jgi:hypothetical protein
MANIYTEDDSHLEDFHTHLLKFINEYEYIKTFWKYNKDVETCWVPWEWCETKKQTNKNNAISMFSPSYDTLHAVDISYDHLKQQRNQIYGNLWFTDVPDVYNSSHLKLDLKGRHSELYIPKSPVKEKLKSIGVAMGILKR